MPTAADDGDMTYPGGKNGSGVYQKIINLMPPHRVYVEAFLGGGAIMRSKLPAEINIGIEIDKKCCDEWGRVHFFEAKNEDALRWLRYSATPMKKDTLIYCDPPYLMTVRSTKAKIYDHEFHTDAEHTELLDILLTLQCMVMISGYDSELYNTKLATWRKVEFTGVTRGGPRTECVWMNFPEPAELHDYRFLGDDRRQRQDIKRQKERWLAKLSKMPSHRRYAIFSAIEDYKRSCAGENAVSLEGDGSSAGGRRPASGGLTGFGCAPSRS